MGPTAQPSQATKTRLNPKPLLNPSSSAQPQSAAAPPHGRRLKIGSLDITGCTPSPPRVPFRSTTLSSPAITFKGFLTTLSLPREEVVTIRGPIHRTQPPFHLFFLYRVLFPLPCVHSLFQVHLGIGTFGTTHGHLDPSLRSPTSLIPHRAVAGASVHQACTPLESLYP
ncbi:hypothetical protein CRG98_021199 [Punica granatum]|uniref:Uncharacterized protein n=1 Tax=Punica granatum TaxID=22663 RepID=A0A2I0JQB6_PUNGR|nr:hypothetical protein CRG98_021199 [Punica granatum]